MTELEFKMSKAQKEIKFLLAWNSFYKRIPKYRFIKEAISMVSKTYGLRIKDIKDKIDDASDLFEESLKLSSNKGMGESILKSVAMTTMISMSVISANNHYREEKQTKRKINHESVFTKEEILQMMKDDKDADELQKWKNHQISSGLASEESGQFVFNPPDAR